MKTRIITTDGKTLFRVSRWIRVENKLVTKRHSLFDYSDRYGMEDGYGYLTVFRHNGKQYAVEQFMRLSYPITYEDENGINVIGAYDSEQWYKPYLLEMDPNGDYYIRLYEEALEK